MYRAALEVGPLPALRTIVLLGSAKSPTTTTPPALNQIPVLKYEELIAGERADFAWRSDLDERSASSMCYTRYVFVCVLTCFF
jgi:hypothetical protein